jgi:hypothetical protein
LDTMAETVLNLGSDSHISGVHHVDM